MVHKRCSFFFCKYLQKIGEHRNALIRDLIEMKMKILRKVGQEMEKQMKFFQTITSLGFCVLLFFSVKSFKEALPDHIYVNIGDEIDYDFQVPVTVEIQEGIKEALANKSAAFISTDDVASYYVTCKLFGLIPVKEIAVTLVEGENVFAGGSQVGIYAKTKGVLVIGMSEITDINGENKSPVKNLIKKGDYIVSVNGESVEKKEELAQAVQENGMKTEVLGIFRDEQFLEVAVEPVHCEDEKYMLGIWVRDDMAGIGTLTFYKDNMEYGALGHPVNDGDTGEKLLMQQGSLYRTNIVGIRRGESGKPGELSGVIYYNADSYLGTVDENTEIGIYGILDGNLANLSAGTYCEIGYKQEIKQGPATILSAVSGEVKVYDVIIEGVSYSGTEVNKGILIQVVDEELIELTGGIVQGMSGSPIIQDGKLVGAVTHVLVNDPTRGYGIFIENMLEH